MALRFTDGFDAGDFAQKYAWSSTAGLSSNNTVLPYGSGRTLAKSPNQVGALTRSITAATTVIAGFACYFTTNDSGFPANLMTFMGDSGAVSHVFLGTGDRDNSVTVYRGIFNGTKTALFTCTVSANTWHYYELKATIDDTTGYVELRIDGSVTGSFTGDTRNAGTSTQIDAINMAGSQNNTGITVYWDDLYVLDTTGSAPYNTYLGDVRVRTIVPTAAGNSTQFTPSTGANYTTVDELPFSTTDYVESSTSGQRDTYTLGDITGATTVYSVQANTIAKKTDASSFSLKSTMRTGSTDYYGSDTPLIATDQTIVDLRTQNPNTATSWTVSDVNGLETGFEVV